MNKPEYNRKWYAKNKESRIAKNKAWRESLSPGRKAAMLEQKRRLWNEKYSEMRRVQQGIRPMAVYLAEVMTPAYHKAATHKIWTETWIVAFRRTGCVVNKTLQCTPPQFREHIQAQFTNGMTWENYGRGGIWEFDHIKPLSTFDFSDPAQILIAGHFSNVRPLLRQENLKRSQTVKKISGRKGDSTENTPIPAV